MKTKQLLIAFILLMLAGTGASVRAQVAINATNFPDDIFRQWVIDNCDTDGDGTLSTTEAAKKLINVQGKGIANLKGIEYFTAATAPPCLPEGRSNKKSREVAMAASLLF